jgi:hypothetical protein
MFWLIGESIQRTEANVSRRGRSRLRLAALRRHP